ncbi:MAG: DUF3800 domain-containing protein [Candidatus Giovannonibacteria bacterium]|nr:MAG: DUF3800 domain-containing protein [Candidatus Giovannonibacteria bacterium]
MFGKLFQADKKGSDLTLGDYKSIWSKFCFLDESGSLNNPRDTFFTLGFIKCSQPYYLQSKLLYERRKRNFFDEMKFNKLSNRNFEFAKFALDALFDAKSLRFSSYSLYKKGEYFSRAFAANPWQAYEDISLRVLESAVSENEILIVIADHVTTPKDIRFEVNVKRKLNEKFERLAIAGVCRFDSKSNDLLQTADLIVGAINYDLRLATKEIANGDKYKRRFLEHFKNNLGTTTNFINGFRNRNFNIFVDKDAQFIDTIMPSVTNEKRPSS